MKKHLKKICLIIIFSFLLIVLPQIDSNASTYNYDFWKNIVPSSEGMAYKDTYYGKDIPYDGLVQPIWEGIQADGTLYSTVNSIWVRKPNVSKPYDFWDVNQWHYLKANDFSNLGLHDLISNKESIRPPEKFDSTTKEVEVIWARKDAKEQLDTFIKGKLKNLNEENQIIIDEYQEKSNGLLDLAQTIDSILETLSSQKAFFSDCAYVLGNNPSNLTAIKTNAQNALTDYINRYQYQVENQVIINDLFDEGMTKINQKTEIDDIINEFIMIKEKMSHVLILIDVKVNQLLITEYGMGSNENKYVEIYNGTGQNVSLKNYTLTLFNNGIKSNLNNLTFTFLDSDVIENNKTFIIAHPNASDEILAKADMINSDLCSFDGNDAIALLQKQSDSWQIIDLFGKLIDPKPLNAGIKEENISYEDLKVYNDKIYLLDAKHQYKEKVYINEVEVEVQGRSRIFVINSEMKWIEESHEFLITEYVRQKLDDFYQFKTPLNAITPDIVKSNDLTTKAPYVPYSADSSRAAIYLTSAEGIMVTEKYIYVADTKNSRIIKMTKEFLVVEVYLTPKDPIFFQYDGSETLATTLKTVFKPQKIAIDSNERVYVVSQGVYEGIMEYGPKGTFNRFMGKNEVVANPLKIFWAKLFSEAQLQKIALDLPPEFTNITINNDFLYTTSKPDPGAPNASKMIKAINTSGKDILKRNGYVTPDGDARYITFSNIPGTTIGPTIFSAITVNSIGNYTAADSKRGRLFTYDSEGNLLYISGEKGQLSNSINDPVAVAYFTLPSTTPEAEDEELVLVLDRASKSIVSYSTTTFGKLINKATELYLKNDILGAEQYWREVIKMNSNYELGYVGIGKSLLRNGEYYEAMQYFKLGHSSKYYSKAFQLYRDQYLKDNFDWIMSSILLIVIVIGGFFYYKKLKINKKEEEEGGVND